MNLFQWIAVPLAAALFARSLYRLVKGETPRKVQLITAIIWMMAGITIYQPDLTTVVAQALGITRGADLVFYATAIAFLISFFYFYHKNRTTSSAITAIVRQMAIQNARPAPDGSAARDERDKTPASTPE